MSDDNKADVLKSHIAELEQKNKQAKYLMPGALSVVFEYARIGVEATYPAMTTNQPATAVERPEVRWPYSRDQETRKAYDGQGMYFAGEADAVFDSLEAQSGALRKVLTDVLDACDEIASCVYAYEDKYRADDWKTVKNRARAALKSSGGEGDSSLAEFDKVADAVREGDLTPAQTSEFREELAEMEK